MDKPSLTGPGLDSEFYPIETALFDKGSPRLNGETFSLWIQKNRFEERFELNEIQDLLRLHYQYRFDPKGLDALAREQLHLKAAKMLERIKS